MTEEDTVPMVANGMERLGHTSDPRGGAANGATEPRRDHVAWARDLGWEVRQSVRSRRRVSAQKPSMNASGRSGP